MGDVERLKKNPEQAPEKLVAFIDGQILSSPEPSEPEPERPKKKRKLTGPIEPKTPPSGSDDYLTLARVDISMVRLYQTLADCIG